MACDPCHAETTGDAPEWRRHEECPTPNGALRAKRRLGTSKGFSGTLQAVDENQAWSAISERYSISRASFSLKPAKPPSCSATRKPGHQFGAVSQSGGFHQTGAMRLDSSDRETEFVSDDLVRLALGNERDDLALAVRQA